ncbi:PQQ-binding-like beta-propeller repeat protein [Pseudothermotoga sp. U03pept]|uniref:outer membrane protein assembly factor BamB family protein n=1 Tax=Pseudothermotoga sp. U03pept TaxID=3447012 RepID=UPI003F052027
MRIIVLFLCILTITILAESLLVLTSNSLELYDISIPLVPTRIAVTETTAPLKALYESERIYVLCESQIELYDSSLNRISATKLTEKFSDALLIDELYLFSDYKLSVYSKTLLPLRNYTFAEKAMKVDAHGSNILILHSSGKIVCYTKSMNKLWDLSGPDPFLGMQTIEDSLFVWTKNRFYMFKMNEGYPVYEKEGNFTGNFIQVIRVRDSLVLLDSNGVLRLVPLQGFKIVETISVNAKSMSAYGDYIYTTTKDGKIRVVNVLFSSMKLLHSFSTNALFSRTIPISTKPKTVEPEKPTQLLVEPPKIEKKQIELIYEAKLPMPANTSCVVSNKDLYSTSMYGELINFNTETKRSSSSKISFITTSDLALTNDGTLIMGSWDKSVYIVRNKPVKLRIGSNVSLASSITPKGFVVADDDGVLSHFDNIGNEIWKFSLGNWLVCPAAVHEHFGILTLDWLGILRLIDFSGNLVWATYLEFSNQGAIALSEEKAFVVNNGKLYCIELSSGKVLWTFSQTSSVVNHVVCDNKIVMCYSQSGELYALDHSGKLLSSRKFENLFSIILTKNSRALVFTQTEVALIDQNLKTLSSEKLPYPPTVHPTMAEDGTVYVISNDRLILYSVDDKPATGWAMYLKDQSHSSLLSVNR